jgi:hypothetical protein
MVFVSAGAPFHQGLSMNLNVYLQLVVKFISENPLVKQLAKYINENPLAYAYLGCIAVALVGFIAILFYSARTKRLLALLKGPVPKLSESNLLREFDNERAWLRDKADSAGFLAGLCTVACIILMFWLYRTDNGYTLPLIIAAVLQSATVLEYLFGGCRYDSHIYNVLTNRPELSCLKYLPHLPQVTKNSADGKLYWATLDDFTYAFNIGKNEAQRRISTPLEASEAKALSDAQWHASHEERPLEGELVLLLWRDGTNHKIKTVVTKVKSVVDAPAETLMTRPGKAIIKAASYKFCGGKVAHFCDAPNERIERGWLATADRAHVLLASLRWLDDEQREYCYQLISPGKAYPPISQWAQGQ